VLSEGASLMFRRLSTLLITISMMLSACSTTLSGTPTATLAPTTTVEPTNKPAPTNEQEPTARPDPTATTQPIAKPAPTEVPATQGLQPVSCAFSLPAGANATCYVLFVPENRANSNSRTIELAVAVFKSSSNKPAKDPVVYLLCPCWQIAM
jgi:hypothetical protein